MILARLLLICCFTALLVPAANATGFGGIREASLYPFIQYFTWEEFGDNGNRLLKESGPQYGLGGDITLLLLKGEAGEMTFKGKLELSGGEVNYDGQLQDGTPHSTDVTYFGINNEDTFGWALTYRNATIEPFGGLGYRWWMRDLQGGRGYTEYWTSLSALVGVRSSYTLGPQSRMFVMGGARYPFYNRNDVEHYPGVDAIELKPESEWSAMAECGIRYRQMFASLFYESYIFPESDPVTRYNAYRHPTPGPSSFIQPRSESETFGLRVGWAFK